MMLALSVKQPLALITGSMPQAVSSRPVMRPRDDDAVPLALPRARHRFNSGSWSYGHPPVDGGDRRREPGVFWSVSGPSNSDLGALKPRELCPRGDICRPDNP
jgi:hypothetical protein